jgi:hypothetical protein
VENYFNYFTETEEHFLRRRGGGLLLSTLDWALIETWKDAGIPLEAVLRGIDAAFDRYDQRPSKTKKVNSLAYCSQEILSAAEEMKEAAVGVSSETAPNTDATAKSRANQGFEPETIAAFLKRNADNIEHAKFFAPVANSAKPLALEAANTLRKLASDIENKSLRIEDLERRLTVLEEKLFAALLAATPDEELVTVRSEADRDLAPYRRKMPGAQIDQLMKQYIHKRLLEKYNLPRLSLFYM